MSIRDDIESIDTLKTGNGGEGESKKKNTKENNFMQSWFTMIRLRSLELHHYDQTLIFSVRRIPNSLISFFPNDFSLHVWQRSNSGSRIHHLVLSHLSALTGINFSKTVLSSRLSALLVSREGVWSMTMNDSREFSRCYVCCERILFFFKVD